MASVKCSNCGFGIHYHGEPNGTEYVYISSIDWTEITSSCFNSRKKFLDANTGYPKLFRSDTIEEDFPAAIKKFWKCPKCDSLLFSDDEGNIINSFAPTEHGESAPTSNNLESGVIYDDYLWDDLTEASIADNHIAEEYPPTAFMQLSDTLCKITNPSGNTTCFRKI